MYSCAHVKHELKVLLIVSKESELFHEYFSSTSLLPQENEHNSVRTYCVHCAPTPHLTTFYENKVVIHHILICFSLINN